MDGATFILHALLLGLNAVIAYILKDINSRVAKLEELMSRNRERIAKIEGKQSLHGRRSGSADET